MTNIRRWRPPSLQEKFDKDPKDAGRELDNAIRYIVDGLTQLDSDLPRKLTFGKASVTGSKVNIDTGLDTIENVSLTIEISTAMNEWATWARSAATGGRINIYVWKPTGAGDTTPIASTTKRTVHWMAKGA